MHPMSIYTDMNMPQSTSTASDDALGRSEPRADGTSAFTASNDTALSPNWEHRLALIDNTSALEDISSIRASQISLSVTARDVVYHS